MPQMISYANTRNTSDLNDKKQRIGIIIQTQSPIIEAIR